MIGPRILQGFQNLFHIFQQKEMHENALLKCKKMSWCQSVSKSKKQEKCYLLTASAKVLKGKMTFAECSARTISIVFEHNFPPFMYLYKNLAKTIEKPMTNQAI